MDTAFYYLYQYRYYEGLESKYHFGLRMLLSYKWIGPEEYEICSDNTKILAGIIVELVNRN